jgi:hypothetical protein
MKIIFWSLCAVLTLIGISAILLALGGCASENADNPSTLPTTPQQIATAQAAAGSIATDVAAAKSDAAGVAVAQQKVQAAKESLATLPTTATTQKAEISKNLDDASTGLATAGTALGVHLDAAAVHTAAATTALTGAQKSATKDAKKFTKTEAENKTLKAANPAKTELEVIGVSCIVAAVGLALLAFFAESIPVVGAWVSKLGDFAYELAAIIGGGGLALLTIARFLDPIEKIILWTGISVAALIVVIVVRRYWPEITAWWKGTSAAPQST